MFNLLLCLNQLYSSYPPLHLSGIVLYSFTSLDLVISSSHLLFFSLSSHLFSSLIVLLVSFRSRFVHLPSPLAPLFPYFSNLPEIVFFLGRDRLYPIGFLFPAAFLFGRARFTSSRRRLKCSSVLIFSGLFCFLLFICFTPTAFYPRAYSIFALSHFLKFVFFDLRLTERRVIFSSFSLLFTISGCVTFHLLFPITLVLIHLS